MTENSDEAEAINLDRPSRLHGGLEDSRAKLSAIYQQMLDASWLPPHDEGKHGIILQVQDESYISEPPAVDQRLLGLVRDLGIPVAFTLGSGTASLALQNLSTFQTNVWIESIRTKYLVFENIAYLSAAELDFKVASACLCRQEGYVLVWCNNLESLLEHVQVVESGLIDLIQRWRFLEITQTSARTAHNSTNSPRSRPRSTLSSSREEAIRNAIREENAEHWLDWEVEDADRSIPRSHQINVALAMLLVGAAQVACITRLALEIRQGANLRRLALILLVPIFSGFSMFFMLTITGSLFQIFGRLPSDKSRCYSGTLPDIRKADLIELPHITIQLAVYKEGLALVLIPTVKSLLAAIKQYEEHGGSASIYVNDDGMQAVEATVAEARASFYAVNNIGWCARPRHSGYYESSEPGAYMRKGLFKKASNMNNALDLSVRVDEEFEKLVADMSSEERTRQKQQVYRQAMRLALEKGKVNNWADGNIQIGDLILLVDSDTRVPVDCLLYAAIEMHENPQLAILQHSSGVLQVGAHGFERCMAYFTRTIYTAMEWAVASGDDAPFLGHNAFIRWNALRDLSYKDDDGEEKWWSESHVSEDFDLSIRLHVKGYVVRLATYHEGGFKEGVSLYVYDEISRWQKYIYGCNEIVFYPLRFWLFRGPITIGFRYFVWSNLFITSKLSIIAYLFNYYAIASAFPLAIINYFIIGWIKHVDKFYISSWRVFIGVLVVFNGLAPLGISMAKHRFGKDKFLVSMIEAMKWSPFFALFFMGLSYHLCKAVLHHFLEMHMEWQVTGKEYYLRRGGLSKILYDFKDLYIFLLALIGGMIYLGVYAPSHWRITNVEAVGPLALQVGCHFLLLASTFFI